MPIQILSPGTDAAVSTEVDIVPGATGMVSLYTELNDGLTLPQANGGGFFLLPNGDKLLLPSQAGGDIDHKLRFPIELKDPLGLFQPSGLQLRSTEPFRTLGPGKWRVRRPPIDDPIGFAKDV